MTQNDAEVLKQDDLKNCPHNSNLFSFFSFFFFKVVSWLPGKEKRIVGMSFHPSGAWILVACADGTVHTFQISAVIDGWYGSGENDGHSRYQNAHKKSTFRFVHEI